MFLTLTLTLTLYYPVSCAKMSDKCIGLHVCVAYDGIMGQILMSFWGEGPGPPVGCATADWLFEYDTMKRIADALFSPHS